MQPYLKLIRWKNLIIILGTMLIMRYFVLIPILQNYGLDYYFADTGFIFLCLSALLIAAGGNVINDYFDRKTDYINRPDSVIVGFSVKRRIVIAIHLILSIFGVIAGFIASYYAGSLKYGLFFILIFYVLWKYSTYLKKTVFFGNFTVALMIALIPAIVGISECLAIKNTIGELSVAELKSVKISTSFLLGFAVFAFIYNFIREIVKDMEDIEGDLKTGVKSIAVKLGIKNSNYLVAVLCIIAASSVAVAYHIYVSKLSFIKNDIFSTLYVWCLIIVPSIFLAIKSLLSSKKQHYTYMSKLLKIIMIFGIMYSFIISFMIYGNS